MDRTAFHRRLDVWPEGERAAGQSEVRNDRIHVFRCRRKQASFSARTCRNVYGDGLRAGNSRLYRTVCKNDVYDQKSGQRMDRGTGSGKRHVWRAARSGRGCKIRNGAADLFDIEDRRVHGRCAGKCGKLLHESDGPGKY